MCCGSLKLSVNLKELLCCRDQREWKVLNTEDIYAGALQGLEHSMDQLEAMLLLSPFTKIRVDVVHVVHRGLIHKTVGFVV
jgi:hypothetical protein